MLLASVGLFKFVVCRYNDRGIKSLLLRQPKKAKDKAKPDSKDEKQTLDSVDTIRVGVSKDGKLSHPSWANRCALCEKLISILWSESRYLLNDDRPDSLSENRSVLSSLKTTKHFMGFVNL